MNILFFLVREFGPLIVFYGVNHIYGLKTAIVASVSFGLLEVTYLKATHQQLSSLLKYSIAVTIIFGGVDLYLDTPMFIKYEASFSNILTGFFFALTLRTGQRPVIQEFAEKKWTSSGQVVELTEDRKYFFRFCTAVWTAYFFIKAGVYAWISSHYSIEESLAIRSVIGNSTFYGLMFINVYCAQGIRTLLAKARLLPSLRATGATL